MAIEVTVTVTFQMEGDAITLAALDKSVQGSNESCNIIVRDALSRWWLGTGYIVTGNGVAVVDLQH